MAWRRSPAKPNPSPRPRVLTTDDHERFIRRIIADVDDDAPRLAYADWLGRTGRAVPGKVHPLRRSTQRHLGPRNPRRKARPPGVRRGCSKSTATNGTSSPPAPDTWLGQYERGFPTLACCDLKSFPADAATIWQVAPVTRLVISDYAAAPWDVDFKDSWIKPESYRAVAAMPQLVHIRSLAVCECCIKAKHLKPLLASPHLTNLRELHLLINPLGDAGCFRVVAEAPRRPPV